MYLPFKAPSTKAIKMKTFPLRFAIFGGSPRSSSFRLEYSKFPEVKERGCYLYSGEYVQAAPTPATYTNLSSEVVVVSSHL
jgi:hypothetical protein